jgi:hypothetical protein
MDGNGMKSVEETEGREETVDGFVPVAKAREAGPVMGRELIEGGDFFESRSPFFQSGPKALLNKTRGKPTEGEFGLVEGTTIGRDKDQMNELHPLEKPDAGRDTAFAKAGPGNDLGDSDRTLGKKEDMIDESDRTRKPKGLGQVAEIGCQLVMRFLVTQCFRHALE